MRLKSLAVCGLLLWVGSSAAQVLAPMPQGRGGIADGEFFLTPGRSLGSLEELIAKSKLIVEVTVISAFPATKRVITGPVYTVSTDFVLAPQRVLKGQFAGDRFVVSQRGGHLEGRRHFTRQYPGELMSPGQRYVLFLNDPDPRDPQPQRESLERFAINGTIYGVALVKEDKVEFSKDLPFRDSYSELSAAQFMDQVATKVKEQSR